MSNYSSKHFSSSGGNKRKENSYFQNIRLIWNLSLKNRPTDIVLLGYKSKFSFAGRGRKLKSDFFPLIPDSLYLSKNCQRLLCSCMPFFLTLELPEMTNKEFVVPISTLLREEMWWEEKKKTTSQSISFDLKPNSPSWNQKNCPADSTENLYWGSEIKVTWQGKLPCENSAEFISFAL